ncbi:hypothetical protein HIM_03401 [Hirsutella minnesotensis 3608]|uniref:Magnesium-dependent phosphatase-1 n=1 Tax=Hirsutella minnesotensis 3608 TaxID=1043627 RepID=A0A0F7ZQD9_9HYPO|nr:hypothetical protein HIM_03401 [Hirsutella minnesotensis 3608]
MGHLRSGLPGSEPATASSQVGSATSAPEVRLRGSANLASPDRMSLLLGRAFLISVFLLSLVLLLHSTSRLHIRYPTMPKKAAKTGPASPLAVSSLPASLRDPSLALPKLVVFDLDYTLWPFWVDTHVTPPIKPNAQHSAASDRTGEHLAFYDDVPSVLQLLPHAGGPEGVKLGVASRTSAPSLARDLLQMLHLPQASDTDVEARPRRAIDVFDGGMEIYPGSKIRHFEKLQKRTGIPFEDMLFFDDESRNRETEKLGITMWLVRDGVTWGEIERGVDEWRRRRGHQR